MFDRLELMKKQYQDILDQLQTGTLDVKTMTDLL